MSRPRRLACLFSLLPALALAGPAEDALRGRLAALLHPNGPHSFSGGVLIERHGQPLYAHSQALPDRPASGAPTLRSQYQVASISKQFTAALVLREVAAGRLQLDVPIARYLPALRDDWAKQVNTAQLLQHSAGVVAEGQPLQHPPGSRFAYSNAGYDLLGEIVAASSGQTFASQAQALLSQCGMRASNMPQTIRAEQRHSSYPQLVDGYADGSGGQLQPTVWGLFAPDNPSGGLLSTLADLVRWNHCLHGGTALPAAQYQAMLQPGMQRSHRWGQLGYGYGIQRLQQDGLLEYSHNGFVPGYASVLLYYPEQDLSLVVLANTGRQSRDQVENFAVHDRIRSLVRDYLRQRSPASLARL